MPWDSVDKWRDEDWTHDDTTLSGGDDRLEVRAGSAESPPENAALPSRIYVSRALQSGWIPVLVWAVFFVILALSR